MQLCAITDRSLLASEAELLNLAQGWATAGVDFIQLREKDLSNEQLASLATRLIEKIAGSRTKLLMNIARPEAAAVARDAGALGVHLAGQPVPGLGRRVRQAFREAIISVPCHSLEEIEIAREERVDLMLYSPVFEKGTRQPQGLEALRRACAVAQGIPVFALGGVTSGNAADCVAAGAAGVAGVRLFISPLGLGRLAAASRQSEPSLPDDI